MSRPRALWLPLLNVTVFMFHLVLKKVTLLYPVRFLREGKFSFHGYREDHVK